MSFMAKETQTRGPFDHIVSAPATVNGGGQYVHYYPGTQPSHAYSQQMQGVPHYTSQGMLFPSQPNPVVMSNVHTGCQHMEYHDQAHYQPNSSGPSMCSLCHGYKKCKTHNGNGSSHKNI